MGSPATGRIDIAFTLEVSGIADLKVSRTVGLRIDAGEGLAAAEARLAAGMEREHATNQQIGRLLLHIARWKRAHQAELDLLLQQDVAMHMDLEADASGLEIAFRAEYLAAALDPLVHPVRFDPIPSPDEVIRKLDGAWQILRRIFMLAQTAGSGAVTKAVPPPFLDSIPRPSTGGAKAGRDLPPQARAATPEEAKKLTERYLDHFRFPFEVEEHGVRYGFIPRVEIEPGRRAIRLTMTLLMPPPGGQATLRKGGSKAIVVPIDEIYVRGEELNRKTQEGLLELIKGLCRTLGKERGLAGEIDITRPR